MRTKITIAIALVFVIGLIAILVTDREGADQVANEPVLNGAAGGTFPAGTVTYSMEDVSQHATSSSCWTAVNGKVYDVTAWVPNHPGGRDAILSLCGKDGSAAFNNQHGGQANPAQAIESFFIGELSGPAA